jgi:hypothetical protein
MAFVAAVGDVNGDGSLDVVVANHCWWDCVYVNDGHGDFTVRFYIGWPAYGFGNALVETLADMDGDGDLDYLTGTALGLDTGALLICVNNGSGAFAPGPLLNTVTRPPGSGWTSRSCVVGDFTGDGLPDVAASDVLFVNEGGLNFSTVPAPGLSSVYYYAMAAGDVDGDGDLDISVEGKIWLNDGFGQFVDSGQLLYPEGCGNTFADFNGDGSLDLVIGASWFGSGRQVVYLNDGAGHFTEHQELPVPSFVSRFAVADINNDGWCDLISREWGPGWPPQDRIHVYLNDGTGFLVGPVQTITSMKYTNVAVGDMDNDGWVDLVVTQEWEDWSNHLFLNVLGKRNTPPVADAGGPYAADVGGQLTLDGTRSTDPNADTGDRVVRYEWDLNGDGVTDATGEKPTLDWSILYDLGLKYPADPNTGEPTNQIVLTVTDTFGATGTATATLTIYDNRPVAAFTASPNPVESGQPVALDASGSSHGRPDRAIVKYDWALGDGTTATDAGQTVGHTYSMCGPHNVTLTVTDNNSPPKTDTKTIVVTVVDTTPPVVESVWATPSVLWPPDHKMVNVTVDAVLSDRSDPAPTFRIVDVRSSEPVNGLGDGDTAPDWEVTGAHMVKLRAERSGNGTGRIYTVTIEATDASGNATREDVLVFVPRDQRRK